MRFLKLARQAKAAVSGLLYLIVFVMGGCVIRRAQLANVGANVKISPTVFFKHPENITVGKNSFINHLSCIWASPHARISIGEDVLIGPSVVVVASNHGLAPDIPIRTQLWVEKDVIIGNDVWIGAHCTILPGVIIGSGCVIGAGAVVSRDPPANTICLGVPARPVRTREELGRWRTAVFS